LKLLTDKTTLTFVVIGLKTVALAGEDIVNEGAEEQAEIGDAEFLGLGAPDTKSAELLSVSVHPPNNLDPEVVFERAIIEVVSFPLAVPYPTLSIICAQVGLVPV
jgi:hypothetical protein